MSVSPSLYGPIWIALADSLAAAALVTHGPGNRVLRIRMVGVVSAARASSSQAPKSSTIFDHVESAVRSFAREANGPAQSHCFCALAMIPALRSSASSSATRTR